MPAPPGAGQGGGGGTIETETGHLQGGGQMGETGIHPDHPFHLFQGDGQGRERQSRQHPAAGYRLGESLRPGQFSRVAPGQIDPIAGGGGEAGQSQPMGFGPMLARPGGAVEKHETLAGSGFGGQAWPNPVVGLGIRPGIAHGLGEESTHPLDGVPVAGHRDSPLIAPGGQGFPGGAEIQPDPDPPGEASDQGALEQTLGVDHQVIALLPQFLEEGPQLLATLSCQGSPTPLPQPQRDDLAHRRMPGRDLAEGLFHHPITVPVGDGGPGVAQGGQGMEHIAEGRGLDHQDVQLVISNRASRT